MAVLAVFILLALMFKEHAARIFEVALEFITRMSGWFLILAVNIFVLAAVGFAIHRFGRIRIGGKDAQPEFSTPAWYAMLLSAGMGIGLMFWSVGEPIHHYASPSPMFEGMEGFTPAAAQAAMSVTFFHWGLHPWGIYALVGLGLAYFAYNRKLPLTIRSIFYPLLGDRIYGFWGNLIDVLSVLATLTGLATSLGLGVKQINAGLFFLFGWDISVTTQIVLIAVITAAATLSVVAGLDSGVKRLSELNMGLAAVFMLFVLFAGPTVFILGGFTQSLGHYLSKLPEMSLWAETFRPSNWQGSWTVFYWAWWISWSPFVGMFIARVSKGRTVREFIIAVLLVPTVITVVWMSTFGGTALEQIQNGVGELAKDGLTDVSLAMFQVFTHLPLSGIISFVGIVLVLVFFVTSSDSGSLVIDSITAGGKTDAPTAQRVFWAVMEGAIAAALIFGGGADALGAIQATAISAGLPFTIVLLIMTWGLLKGLSQERKLLISRGELS
jgi:choline/glycine/proline betaine transport protein